MSISFPSAIICDTCRDRNFPPRQSPNAAQSTHWPANDRRRCADVTCVESESFPSGLRAPFYINRVNHLLSAQSEKLSVDGQV